MALWSLNYGNRRDVLTAFLLVPSSRRLQRARLESRGKLGKDCHESSRRVFGLPRTDSRKGRHLGKTSAVFQLLHHPAPSFRRSAESRCNPPHQQSDEALCSFLLAPGPGVYLVRGVTKAQTRTLRTGAVSVLFSLPLPVSLMLVRR